MRKDFSADHDKRDLQIESQIHIEVQNELEKRVIEEPGLNVASAELLCCIHERFYLRLPEHLRWIEGTTRVGGSRRSTHPAGPRGRSSATEGGSTRSFS
jgi:hypothetical protein